MASGSFLAGKLRSPDAIFGDLHALDALEAEEQFDEVRRRLGGDPLDDRPERLLHVLAEGDALDREAAQVHFHALVRLKHAEAAAGSPGRPHREGYGTSEPRPTNSASGSLFPGSKEFTGIAGSVRKPRLSRRPRRPLPWARDEEEECPGPPIQPHHSLPERAGQSRQ